MLKILVKITGFAVTAASLFGVTVFAISLYLWLFEDDSSAKAAVLGSVFFLVFLGGVAVLFRISEQLEEISKDSSSTARAIKWLGGTYVGIERGEEQLKAFTEYAWKEKSDSS